MDSVSALGDGRYRHPGSRGIHPHPGESPLPPSGIGVSIWCGLGLKDAALAHPEPGESPLPPSGIGVSIWRGLNLKDAALAHPEPAAYIPIRGNKKRPPWGDRQP